MMDDKARLCDALDRLWGQIGREALETLVFEPISAENLDLFLASLSERVAPSYLPFAADDLGVMAVHLWPGRAVEVSPIVYVEDDAFEAQFVCDSLASFPAAIWLWVGLLWRSELHVLRGAIEAMEMSIPNAKPVSDALWALRQDNVSYESDWHWYVDCSENTLHKWRLASVGHPLVDLPRVAGTAETMEVLAQLEPFIRKHPEPELLSILVAAQGPLTLARVAQGFRDARDDGNALIQFRNAMTLALHNLCLRSRDLALASAAVCEAIEANSLAAAVARYSARSYREAL